jgi:type I restriction enzyme S subunit
MSIPVPPFDEQSMIAELLLACDTKRKCLEIEIVLLDELLRAVLDELMTGRLSAVPLVREH